MTPYASLFSPIELAGRRLRNRIVHPSMTTVTGADGRATDRLIQYHLNRARGGAALGRDGPVVGRKGRRAARGERSHRRPAPGARRDRRAPRRRRRPASGPHSRDPGR